MRGTAEEVEMGDIYVGGNGEEDATGSSPSKERRAPETKSLVGGGYVPDAEMRYRRSNNVQKITMALVVFMFAMLIVLIGVASATFHKVKKQFLYSPSITTIYPSIGLPDYEALSWTDVVTAASGSTVNFYAWSDGGGDWDKWISEFLKPKMSELYDITVVHHKLSDTVDAVEKVEWETAHYGSNNGSVDIIWVNLENFARLKNAGNAYGPWVEKVPSAANFDFTDSSIAYDGGIPISGYEFPYNGAQVGFFYNSAKVNSTSDRKLLKSIDGIETWLKENPGRFTYAAPARNSDASDYDFTGSVFVRHVFYALGGPYTDFLGSTTVDTTLYNKRAPAVFKYLRRIEPYLYNASGYYGKHKTYPASNTEVDKLFGNGTVWLTLNYDPLYAAGEIDEGLWPSTAQGYVLTMGTIANTNYLIIPKNAKHKLAAVTTINYVGSAAAMFYRSLPDKLGALQVYDPSCDNFADGGWQTAIDTVDWPSSAPPKADLSSGRLGELASSYINKIQKDWYTCVLNYDSSTAPSYCG